MQMFVKEGGLGCEVVGHLPRNFKEVIGCS